MQRADEYAQAKEEIFSIYHENKGQYGYRRITIVLRGRGILLNHKTVQQLMKQLGLVCRVRMKKYRSYKGEVGKIAPNLLNRNFCAEKPNRKWVTKATVWTMRWQKISSAYSRVSCCICKNSSPWSSSSRSSLTSWTTRTINASR